MEINSAWVLEDCMQYPDAVLALAHYRRELPSPQASVPGLPLPPSNILYFILDGEAECETADLNDANKLLGRSFLSTMFMVVRDVALVLDNFVYLYEDVADFALDLVLALVAKYNWSDTLVQRISEAREFRVTPERFAGELWCRSPKCNFSRLLLQEKVFEVFNPRALLGA